MILRTRDARDPQRIAALIRLYTCFSPALYAYARRKFEQRAEAEEAVTGFLDFIKSARLGFGNRANRDRLRGFLLGAFQDYLGIEALRNNPVAKGPAVITVDFEAAESWLQKEAADTSSPDATYHRAWARCVLMQACALLKEEVAADSGSAAAEVIAAEVCPTGRRTYTPDVAARLFVPPAEALEMIRTARVRLRDLILETVRETVSAQSEVDVEYWDLFKSA